MHTELLQSQKLGYKLTMQIPPEGDLVGRIVPLEDGDDQADGREQCHKHNGIGASHLKKLSKRTNFGTGEFGCRKI